MKDNFSCNINKLVISLLLLLSFSGSLFSQTRINNIINKYARVTSLGTDFVIVNDAVQFAQFLPGDTVLMIQMKGGISIVDEGSNFGLSQDTIGAPGKYEFLIVNSVVAVTNRINFRNDKVNSYDVRGVVQLIKVPSYNTALVDAELTCPPWDSLSRTGGVLALIVGRKLSLDANIDVSGKGFKGGASVLGLGLCVESNTFRFDKFGFHRDSLNSGFKGESQIVNGLLGLTTLYPICPNYAKGKGNNFTGGGGGNGRFSGGGGGSNYGAGGKGGREMNTCTPTPVDGGSGGRQVKNSNMDKNIFLGGGGGSSTFLGGSTPSPGGNGGGIVIILCDTIIGNGNSIIADGETPVTASSNAGAGGGGSGGSVALYAQSYSRYSSPVSTLNIAAKGGNGGNNTGSFGEGGGGGGGMIWLNNITIPTNITRTIANGTPGTRVGASTALPGALGEITTFEPILTGFLFNSIRSSVTDNQIDSICSNVIPKRFIGTRPMGGVAPYTYRWEKSYDQISWTPLYNGPDSINYTTTVLETTTVYFRRTVTDSYITPLVDIGKSVRIIVHPFIKNNVIGNPDTLCYGQNPPALAPLLALQDGNGHYEFTWEVSTDNTNYSLVASGTAGYLPPPGLILTTWYRRRVSSARCVDISAPVRINVLDTVRNNSILTSPQEICNGMLFTDLSGTTAPTLGGGDNTYRFRWESSTDASTWVTAAGPVNGANYNPIESAPPFPGQEYFRRVVLSGSNNVCVNVSKPVLLKEYPVITNNSITSGNQTICSGASPLQLTGSSPLNGKGAGSYTYTWQDSTKSHSWTDIPGYIGILSQSFNPPALTDTTRYRRIVNSSACSDLSKSVIINVHKPIANNNISLIAGGLTDTTICNGGIPHRLSGTVPAGGTGIPGDYAFQWSSSPDNVTWTDISTSGTSRYFQPTSLTTTSYFRRRVISGQCSSESGFVKVVVLPLIKDNSISANQTVCKNKSPEPLTQATGLTLTGGAGSGTYSFLWEESTNGVTWNPAAGTNNASNGNYQPPALATPIKYRRTVNSGANNCCTSTSNILDITIDSLPAGSTINAGPDTSIYSFDHIIRMVADPVMTGGAGKWTVIEGTGSFEDDTDNSTRVDGLSKGLNKFLWTVTKGACKLEDLVDVYVYDMVIPEGFSPNNDAFNNTFTISGLDTENQVATLTIINGAGSEVYSTTNSEGSVWKDWDGKNSKGIDLPEGTYYYLLKITSKANSQVFKKSGFVILKRY
jgi:gliding motility-associated-like protein